VAAGAVAGVSAGPFGAALKITPEGTRFIKFDDRRMTGIAFALGFGLGAAVAALRDERVARWRGSGSKSHSAAVACPTPRVTSIWTTQGACLVVVRRSAIDRRTFDIVGTRSA
jgi:hypothetical protein